MTSSTQSERIFAIDLGDLYLKFVFVENNRAVLWGREELSPIFWQRPLEHIWDLIQNFFLSWKEKGTGSLVLGLSQSFLKGVFAEHKVTRDLSQEKISEAEEKTLAQEFEKNLAEKALESVVASSGILKEEFLLERLTVFERTVDGYAVPHLKGFSGKEIAFKGFAVFLLRSHRNILDYITKQYGLAHPKVVHEAETLLKFARDKKLEGLFLDIGDRISGLFLIQAGKLTASSVLPFGGDRFTSILEKTLGMKTNVAREFKERYVKGQLSEDLRSRVKELFLPEARNLITLIEEGLNTAGFSMAFPLFLMGGTALLPELKEAFEDQGFPCSLFLPKDVLALTNFPPDMNPQYTPLVLQLYAAGA